MYLVAGLGNPGPRYSRTRHNAGFMTVDWIAAKIGASFRSFQGHSLICSAEWGGHRVILAKPQTYMNLSGRAVSGLLESFQIDPGRLLVIYDDAALPLGIIRLRASGSAGGQKGMESLLETLGTQEVPRLRIGVDGEGPPPDLAEYVLEDFTEEETKILGPVLERAGEAVYTVLTEGIDKAMALYNTKKGKDA